MRRFALTLHTLAERLSFVAVIIAVIAFITIPLLVAGQVVGRTFGFSIVGAPDYAAYSFATVSFLGLPYAMKEFAHIRVSFLIDGPKHIRRFAEILSHVLGSALTAFAFYIAWQGVGFSLEFNDISQGHDATPLWIPQSVMVIGFGLLFLLVFSRLLVLLFARDVVLSSEKSIIGEEK